MEDSPQDVKNSFQMYCRIILSVRNIKAGKRETSGKCRATISGGFVALCASVRLKRE